MKFCCADRVIDEEDKEFLLIDEAAAITISLYKKIPAIRIHSATIPRIHCFQTNNN